jgi:D-arabinose 5-phosphate isomerase GutQ
MADSAPKIAAKERREAASAIEKKAATLVEQILQSKHFIVFTGAGISTSAGKLQILRSNEIDVLSFIHRNPRLSWP